MLQPTESIAVLSPEDVPVFSSADIKLEMLSSNVSTFLINAVRTCGAEIK